MDNHANLFFIQRVNKQKLSGASGTTINPAKDRLEFLNINFMFNLRSRWVNFPFVVNLTWQIERLISVISLFDIPVDADVHERVRNAAQYTRWDRLILPPLDVSTT